MAKYKYLSNLYGETRYATALRMIQRHAPARDKDVVDVGAGDPPLSSFLDGARVTTIDFNESTSPDIVCDLSVGIPLEDNCCDLVLAAEILEHMYGSCAFLAEIRRILRPGGHVLVTVPNMGFLPYRLLWLLGRVPPFAARADCTYRPHGRPGGHVRDYTFQDLREILTEAGFRVMASDTNGLIVKRFRFPRPLTPKTFGQKAIMLAQAP